MNEKKLIENDREFLEAMNNVDDKLNAFISEWNKLFDALKNVDEHQQEDVEVEF